MTVTTSQIEALNNEVRAAAQRLSDVLTQRWPVGSTIYVFLSHRQCTPSKGEVVGNWGGRITVKLYTTNRRGYRTIKHVHWSRCV